MVTSWAGRWVAVAYLASAAAGLGGCAESPLPPLSATERSAILADTATLSESDRRFVLKVASSGQYHAEVARLAEQRTQNPLVKAYAASLVQHHDRANVELKALVRARGMPWIDGFTAERRAVLDAMAALPLDLFERRFIEQVGIADREADVLIFEAASRSLDDAALRAWAARILPVLQQHLALARQLPVRVQARLPSRWETHLQPRQHAAGALAGV